MSKYIIKNCRFLSDTITAGGKKEQNICGYEIDKKCQDCTDCVLKQIVEKCKQEIRTYWNTVYDESTNALHFGRKSFAYNILELIDIQEVE